MKVTVQPSFRGRGRRGFSLLELIIVLLVTSILAGLLMPAMTKVRENVNKVICSSNLRQHGIGFAMYASDYKERFPSTGKLVSLNGVWEPHELMAVHHGAGWDGLGLLYAGDYCGAPSCYYCPSHHGEHPFERYAHQWDRPGSKPIYINYHYAGHLNWISGTPRFYRNLDQIVLVTDGLRTATDFNHHVGLNALRGDGAVQWREDGVSIVPLLPESDAQGWMGFDAIWGEQIERE